MTIRARQSSPAVKSIIAFRKSQCASSFFAHKRLGLHANTCCDGQKKVCRMDDVRAIAIWRGGTVAPSTLHSTRGIPRRG